MGKIKKCMLVNAAWPACFDPLPNVNDPLILPPLFKKHI